MVEESIVETVGVNYHGPVFGLVENRMDRLGIKEITLSRVCTTCFAKPFSDASSALPVA